jgi:stage III sporulation protein AH
LKQLVKKNQFIITALAIMIAVAGYLRFAQSNGAMNDYLAVNNMNDSITSGGLTEISEEDILAENQALNQALGTQNTVGLVGNELEAQDEILTEINSLDVDLENTSGNPGEAVLASGSTNLEMIANMKLDRETLRSSNREALNEIINNMNVAEEQRQAAAAQLLEMTTIADKEAAAEMLLEAKGFTDVVVSMNGDGVDVVVNVASLTDAERAQIEDIVKRKTEIGAENIVITPISQTMPTDTTAATAAE